MIPGPTRPCAAFALLALVAIPARAASVQPVWMAGASGGIVDKAGDRPRDYEALSLTRKLGTAYARVTLTRFQTAVRQIGVELPSTYRLASFMAGATFGPWFIDGYGTIGRQDYRATRTPVGTRPAGGRGHSPVQAVGGDAGYVAWIGRDWALSPVVTLQYTHARALREQFGPEDYETVEQGITGSAGLRAFRVFGPDRLSSAGLFATRLVTTNQSAALASGTRGAVVGGVGALRDRDGWSEAGASASLAVTRRLLADVAASRSLGSVSGDATVVSAGVRLLF